MLINKEPNSVIKNANPFEAKHKETKLTSPENFKFDADDNLPLELDAILGHPKQVPNLGYTPEEFRKYGYKMVDTMIEYFQNAESTPVNHSVEPGFLRDLIVDQSPEEPESFDMIDKDVKDKLLPGVLHWQSPNFFGYYPCSNSFPSILADMYCQMLNCQGFTWATCPSITELEAKMCDWVVDLLHLPRHFLTTSGVGCGSIHSTASEALLVTAIASRTRVLRRLTENTSDAEIRAETQRRLTGRLIMYCSDMTHACAQKTAKMLNLRLKVVVSDQQGVMRGEEVYKEMKKDVDAGLIPFHIITTIGTTGVCAVDDIPSIVEACKKIEAMFDALQIWVHVDAAYAGSAFVFKEIAETHGVGVDLVDSFVFNPHKWLRVTFDCSIMFVKDRVEIISALSQNASYFYKSKLRDGTQQIEYKDMEIPLGRTFRSLKLYFVMRAYGKRGLKQSLGKNLHGTHWFANKVREDNVFQFTTPVRFGLVVLNVKPLDESEGIETVNLRTKFAAKLISEDKNIYITPFMFKQWYVLRVAVGSHVTELEHVQNLYTKFNICGKIAQTASREQLNLGAEN